MIIYTADHNRAKRPEAPADITKAPGVSDGLGIVWEVGNVSGELSDAEKAAVVRRYRAKPNWARVSEIKRMLCVMPVSKVVKAGMGRRGWSESSITKIAAALSEAAGEGLE